MINYIKQYHHNLFARWFLLLAIFYLACSTVLLCQASKERISVAWDMLTFRLFSQGIDTSYIDGDVIDIDSSIGTKRISCCPINDPYGTLRDCFVFAIRTANASVDTNAMIVIMKNGQIVWMSERFDGEFGGRIDAIMDMNKDSTVDIISHWMCGMQQVDRMLWIHSWDGKYGKAINSLDSTQEGRVSQISGIDFDFVNKDDGVWEIRAKQDGYKSEGGYMKRKSIIYRWNAGQYGEWKRMKGREK
jgi:hypothetical protein